MRPRLLLFTKPAIPGRVKTRLAATIGRRRAADLHRALVGDVTSKLRGQASFDLELAWALDPDEAPPDWPEVRGLPWRPQNLGDLGDRLFVALHEAAAAGAPVAAVGSDHPEVSAADVELAFSWLGDYGLDVPGFDDQRLDADGASDHPGRADLVIGPAVDGGYFLIALRAPCVHRRLFEGIDWSTEHVRAQTLERAAELGFRVVELAPGHDIDREADLRRLAARLDAGTASCERTHRLLLEWGWLQSSPVEGRSGEGRGEGRSGEGPDRELAGESAPCES